AAPDSASGRPGECPSCTILTYPPSGRSKQRSPETSKSKRHSVSATMAYPGDSVRTLAFKGDNQKSPPCTNRHPFYRLDHGDLPDSPLNHLALSGNAARFARRTCNVLVTIGCNFGYACERIPKELGRRRDYKQTDRTLSMDLGNVGKSLAARGWRY